MSYNFVFGQRVCRNLFLINENYIRRDSLSSQKFCLLKVYIGTTDVKMKFVGSSSLPSQPSTVINCHLTIQIKSQL